MFFCPTVPASRESCTYSLSLLTYQLTNFQITVEDALHASLCTEEYMWEITESSKILSVQINFNIIVRIGAAKVSALDNRIFRQRIYFPWFMIRQWRFLHSHRNDEMYPPSAPLLTHSSALGPRFLNSGRSKPSELDPWNFPHIPPSPGLNVCRICPIFRNTFHVQILTSFI